MMNSLSDIFNGTFDRSRTLAWAREEGAVERLRLVHPYDFCLALCGASMGDETRSIATARRLFARLTGEVIEESSFYQRFSEPMLQLLRRMFEAALDASSGEQRTELGAVLQSCGLRDLRAIDATQVALPKRAAQAMPSTQDGRGGVKLTADLSVLHQQLERIAVTDARTHDRKALRLKRWLHGVLLLVDLGYWDYRLFDSIARRGGFFITPLKSSGRPRIKRIRSGLGKKHVGRVWHPELPFRGTVDLDAEFRFSGGKRTLRIVRVYVKHTGRDGFTRRLSIWLVTNLDCEVMNPEQLSTLYRLRWEVEVLLRMLKTVGRLDQIQSQSPVVVQCFMTAALIGYLLAQQICAAMRRERPQVEPSIYRVMTLVLGHLANFAAGPSAESTTHTRNLVRALWREGVNPNPGRPYSATKYALQFRKVA